MRARTRENLSQRAHKKMVRTTRDRNLLKICLVLPLLVGLAGWCVHAMLRLVGLEKNGTLASVGAVTLAYFVARLAENFRKAANDIKWDGKTALVTGCTSGLGLAYARGLRSRGCGLVLVSRDEAKLEKLRTALLSEFPENKMPIDIVAFDFSSPDRSFYDSLPLKNATLVVNNVGVGTEDPLSIDEISAEECDAMIAVNCAATTHMCRAVLPLLAAASTKGAAIVNVSSGSANQPTPYLSVYAATKAYIAHLSKSLDREWRGRGVRVLCVAPYYISGTGLFKSNKPSFNAPRPEVVVDGTLDTLARFPRVELTMTNRAHAFIAFLFCYIGEDPVLQRLAQPIAKIAKVNASMIQVMTKARQRHLSKK